jgi:hypothetical protein
MPQAGAPTAAVASHLSLSLPQAEFERQADPNDPTHQALLEEMRTHLKKV